MSAVAAEALGVLGVERPEALGLEAQGTHGTQKASVGPVEPVEPVGLEEENDIVRLVVVALVE